MKAVIGRTYDGWSTTGFVALLEDDSTVMASSAMELMKQLHAKGVKDREITFSGDDEGDRSLSADQQAQLRKAWHELPPN